MINNSTNHDTRTPANTSPATATPDQVLRAKALKTKVLKTKVLKTKVLKIMAKKTFCTIATTSPAGRSHSAGVVYDWVDGTLWVHASGSSRKARSIAANPHVGICIPFRRLPVGPPFTIHFQATAELVAMDDPRIRTLLDAGELGGIAGHGALDMPDGSFIAIRPTGTIHSYGPGARIIDLIRDPLNSGAASFSLDEGGAR